MYRIYYPDPTNVGASSSTDYEEYGYNVNSQVTSVRRRSGIVIGTPRDTLGRVTIKDVPATAEDVYFSYDNQGRLLSALFNNTAGNGVAQTYDGLGRMATRAVFGRQLSYQYDLRGRRTRLTHPDGFYVNYGYSNTDELLTLTDSTAATVATFGYDGPGARTSLTRPNGASTSYAPDALERLQQLTQDLSGTGFDLTETFAYNPAGQISSKTVSNDASYTPVPSPPNSTTTAQFDGQNQLTNFAGSTVVDDANANVWTGLGSLAYTYDALSQLRGASGGVTVDYDPAGMLRRVTAGSTTTEFLYDGADLVAEYNGSTVLRRFVHGASDDEPLVAYEGSGTTNKTWLHADERGSIIAASDASGVAASSVKYTADGDSGTLASPFGYTGQLYLPELQLYYYKARMYSAKAGRFLQPDPIQYRGGMNVYAYAGNDPVSRTDPSGLCFGTITVTNTWSVRADDDPASYSSTTTGFQCVWDPKLWFPYAPPPPPSTPPGCGVYLPGANGCGNVEIDNNAISQMGPGRLYPPCFGPPGEGDDDPLEAIASGAAVLDASMGFALEINKDAPKLTGAMRGAGGALAVAAIVHGANTKNYWEAALGGADVIAFSASWLYPPSDAVTVPYFSVRLGMGIFDTVKYLATQDQKPPRMRTCGN